MYASMYVQVSIINMDGNYVHRLQNINSHFNLFPSVFVLSIFTSSAPLMLLGDMGV